MISTYFALCTAVDSYMKMFGQTINTSLNDMLPRHSMLDPNFRDVGFPEPAFPNIRQIHSQYFTPPMLPDVELKFPAAPTLTGRHELTPPQQENVEVAPDLPPKTSIVSFL